MVDAPEDNYGQIKKIQVSRSNGPHVVTRSFHEFAEKMGNGAFFKKKKPPIVRREPLTTADAIISNEEAKERLVGGLKEYPPGIHLRWDQILEYVNVDTPPTEEDPDPLRVNLSMNELKSACRMMYAHVKYVSSDGLALLREYMPKLYDKHSVDRGRRVSQRERKEKKIVDECFVYGELEPELFATIYLKVISVYGQRKEGLFYDLGCGVGQLVSYHCVQLFSFSLTHLGVFSCFYRPIS